MRCDQLLPDDIARAAWSFARTKVTAHVYIYVHSNINVNIYTCICTCLDLYIDVY